MWKQLLILGAVFSIWFAATRWFLPAMGVPT